MPAPGTAGVERLVHWPRLRRNGAAAQAFGPRPVSNSDLYSVTIINMMRETDRSGVLVA